MKLEDKVAIVTGGAKGIGEGIARSFAAEGARVVIVDRDEPSGRKTSRDLDGSLFLSADVSSNDQVARFIQQTVEHCGHLDILVNNAGTHLPKSVEDTSEEEWDRILSTNLKSTFLCSKHAIPHLRRTKGCIVNISSMVGVVGQGNAGAYAASKAGQIGLTMNMALDLAKDQIRVNAICPGWVQTPLVNYWFEQQPDPAEARKYIFEAHPLGRIATTEEIGRAAVFLASSDSSFVTGTAMHLDGAITLGY